MIGPDDSVVLGRATRGLYVVTGGPLAGVDPFDLRAGTSGVGVLFGDSAEPLCQKDEL